jgi:hypothetical protein
MDLRLGTRSDALSLPLPARNRAGPQLRADGSKPPLTSQHLSRRRKALTRLAVATLVELPLLLFRVVLLSGQN